MDIYSGDGNLLQPSLRHDLGSLVLPPKDLGHTIVLTGGASLFPFPTLYFRSSVRNEHYIKQVYITAPVPHNHILWLVIKEK